MVNNNNPIILKFVRTWRYISMLVCTCLIAAGCGPDKHSFRMSGSIKGMSGGDLYVYNLDDANGRLDTLHIKDGEFRYAGTVDQPTIYTIVFPNALEQVFVVQGGDELTYKAKANDLKNFEVDGNEDNELLNTFRRETNGVNENKERSIAKDFINMHPETMAAVAVFSRYFVHNDLGSQDCKTLLKTLMKHQPKNTYLMKISGELKKAQAGMVGNEVPELSLETKKGKKVDIRDKSKPWTLLFFWATWHADDYLFLNMARTVTRDNEDKLHCVGVSLDSQIFQWEATSRPDSLIIDHCCDGMAWETEAVQKMGVTTLPVFYLIDSNHKIVATGTTREEMQSEVRKKVK